MAKKRFTYEPGRAIYLDGSQFIGISREGDTAPHIADQFARHITKLLNRSAKAKSYLRSLKERETMSQEERRERGMVYLEND